MHYPSLLLVSLTLLFSGLTFDRVFVWRVGITLVLAILGFGYWWSLPRQIKKACHTQQLHIVEALASALHAKDNFTFEHVRRVQIYAAGLAKLVGCNELEIRALRKGALLHDIGKLGVPDAILIKRGQLTADEFTIMKQHTVIGAAILERVGFDVPVVPIVRGHHERWDGSGYPDGLKGEAIPVTARILSIVDVFDAVRETRPYRPGMTRQEAIDLLLKDSGTRYDPELVGLFLTNLPRFEAVIQAERNYNASDFGVNAVTPLSATALQAQPAAGLAPATTN